MRPLVLVLFALSGLAGLVYESVWLRLFGAFFGVTLYATSAVLAAFMGGLAIGAAWASKRIERKPPTLGEFAALEVLIALSALGVPFAIELLGRSAPVVAAGDGPGGLILRFACAFVILAVPTVLMGATLPVVARCLTADPERAAAVSGGLYAVNTLGAVAGIALATLVALPKLGVLATNATAAGLDLAVAAVAYGLRRRDFGEPVVAAREGAPPVETFSRIDERFALAVVATSGFTALVYQLVWIRAISFVTADTTFGFGATLAAFLMGLGLGSAAVSSSAQRTRTPWGWLGAAQVVIGCYALFTPTLFRLLHSGVVDASGAFWWKAVLVPFGLASLALYLPTFLMGASLPFAFRIASSALGSVGLGTGRVYAANTAGAIAGALLGGLVLVPTLGSKGALILAALGSGAAGVAAFRRSAASGERETEDPDDEPLPFVARWARYIGVPGVGVGAVAVGIGLAQPFLDPAQLGERKIVFQQEDSAGLAEVLETPRGHRVLMTDRTHRWGSDEPRMVASMRRQGYLPLLLHPKPTAVVEIGIGTGVSLAPAIVDPAVETLDVVEISPAVAEAARQFSAHNADLLASSKTRLLLRDGRQFLTATSNTYDVIVLGLFAPFRPSAGYLFTREMYERCRARLRTGGVVVHWIPLDQISPQALRTVFATFQGIFPEMHAWERGPYVALVGTEGELRFERTRLLSGANDPVIRDDLKRFGIDASYFLTSHLLGPRGARAFADGAPPNTENRLRVELSRFVPSAGGYQAATANLAALLNHREPVQHFLPGVEPKIRFQLSKMAEARRQSLFGAIAQAKKDHPAAYEHFVRAVRLNRRDEIAAPELARYQQMAIARQRGRQPPVSSARPPASVQPPVPSTMAPPIAPAPSGADR